jgi:hypothetical protein
MNKNSLKSKTNKPANIFFQIISKKKGKERGKEICI